MKAALLGLIVALGLLPLSAQSPDEEMARLREADQAVRARPVPTGEAEIREIQAQAHHRLDRARGLLKEDLLKDPHSYDDAALIFQHGESLDDFLVARELAILACFTKATYGSMPFLAEDRFLVKLGRPQRFGSQHTGMEAPNLGSVHETGMNAVTDKFRMDAFLPPLRFSRSRSAGGAASAASDQIMMRLAARMKPDAKGPEWITDPARSPSAKVLARLDARELSRRASAALRAKLLSLYRRDQFFIPGDYHLAAELLLATSHNASDLLLANEWAALAVMRLHAPAWRTFAETWDRYAQAIGHPTRYGSLPGQSPAPSIPPAVNRSMKGEHDQ